MKTQPSIEYSVRYRGEELKKIELTYEQYKDQASRDAVRKELAHEFLIPPHYLRLMRIGGNRWHGGK